MEETLPRILVLDDEPLVLRALGIQLERFDFEVETTDDPQEAIERLEAETFDVFICDNQMPKMRGPEVLAQIEGQSPEMKRFMLTGSAPGEEGDPAQLSQLEVIEVFRKPCQVDEIVLALNRALGLETVESRS